MATETWPPALQDRINQAGFQYQLAETVLTTENTVGPKKKRRQYTTGQDVQKCSIRINRSEWTTFENFFKTTLNGGVTPFYFLDPLTDTNHVYRFTSPPSISNIGGNEFTVNMAWERTIDV